MAFPPFDEVSIPAIAHNRALEYGDRTWLIAHWRDGRRTADWQHYSRAEIAAEGQRVSAALGRLGLRRGDRVAVMGANRPRWVVAATAALSAGLTVVPVYPTLLPGDACYVVRHAGCRLALCDTLERADKLLDALDGDAALARIVVFDPLEDVGGSGDPRIESYDRVLARDGADVDLDAIHAAVAATGPDDDAFVIYTSGTTGRPKGVVLTHGNLLSQRPALGPFDLSADDVFLNHLPFCHSFGLTTDLLGSAMVGATLAIADGLAPDQIRAGLTSIRPTVLMSVPRLFEKIFVQVQAVLDDRPPAVRRLVAAALRTGRRVFEHRDRGAPLPLGLRARYAVARRLLGGIKRRAGLDRVRVAFAGGGPTSAELCRFFQSLGIDIFQGYGLTETSPIVHVNRPGANRVGTVGPPIAGCETRLADDGEILLRGPMVMRGYLDDAEATAAAIDGDGWFHTGDVGQLDADGYLTITDRKKELIITSAGKNIAPLGIESAFNTERHVERVVVIGDARKYLVALVCPEFDAVRAWAARQGLVGHDGGPPTDAELAASDEVRALLQQAVDRVNDTLPRFQQLKTFAVMDHAFGETTGELTATQKVKRRAVDAMYADVIGAMYPGDGSAL